MNAICLFIDRLHAGYLGTYGNAWVETPAIDRMASQSCVFDTAFVDTPRLRDLYYSYWQGNHALLGRQSRREAACMARLLAENGVHSMLLTDEPSVAQHPLVQGFTEMAEFRPPEQPRTANDEGETHLVQVFSRMVEWLETAPDSFCLWTHLSGLNAAWDAPYGFRDRFAEEDDPAPPDFVEPPGGILAEGYDPDVLLGVSQAYAGQVALVDLCIEGFLEFFAEWPRAENTMVVFASTRGFPLGEHRRVGPCDEAIYGELVQVPLIIHVPEANAAGIRGASLVYPSDVYATLLEWFGASFPPGGTIGQSLLGEIRGEIPLQRDRLCLSGPDGQLAIRTPAWYLRKSTEVELFAKPDDRWEVNDVTGRCIEIAEELQDEIAHYVRHLQEGTLDALPELSPVLREGLD